MKKGNVCWQVAASSLVLALAVTIVLSHSHAEKPQPEQAKPPLTEPKSAVQAGETKPVITAVTYQSDQTDTTPVSPGIPMLIEIGDESRTVLIHPAESAKDKNLDRRTAKHTYYVDVPPAAKINPNPIAGWPNFVWDARPLGREYAVTVKLVLWSRSWEEACRALLREWMAHEFEKNTDAANAPQIEVRRAPVNRYWFGIATRLTPNQLLSQTTLFSKQAGNSIDVTFHLDASSLASFLEQHRKGDLLLHFAPLQHGISIRHGYAHVQLDLKALKKIRHDIRHSTLPPGSRFRVATAAGEDEIVYLTQIGRMHVSHNATARVIRDIACDDAAEAAMLLQDPALVGSCLEPHELSINELVKIQGIETEAMADWLRSLRLRAIETFGRQAVKSSGSEDDNNKREGSGTAFLLLPVGHGGSSEKADRTVKMFGEQTGTIWERSRSGEGYRLARVRLYKAVSASAVKNIHMASSTAIGYARISGFAQQMALTQPWWSEERVRKCLAEIQQKYAAFPATRQPDLILQVREIRSKKIARLTDLKIEQKTIERIRFSLNDRLNAIHQSQGKLLEASHSASWFRYQVGHSQGLSDMVEHALKVWGWRCPNGDEVAGRTRERDDWDAKYKTQHKLAIDANSNLTHHLNEANALAAQLAKMSKKIECLHAEILALEKAGARLLPAR